MLDPSNKKVKIEGFHATDDKRKLQIAIFELVSPSKHNFTLFMLSNISRKAIKFVQLSSGHISFESIIFRGENKMNF